MPQMSSGRRPVFLLPMSMMMPLSAAVTAELSALSPSLCSCVLASRSARLIMFSILMPCAKKSPMGSSSLSGYGAMSVTLPRSGAMR